MPLEYDTSTLVGVFKLAFRWLSRQFPASVDSFVQHRHATNIHDALGEYLKSPDLYALQQHLLNGHPDYQASNFSSYKDAVRLLTTLVQQWELYNLTAEEVFERLEQQVSPTRLPGTVVQHAFDQVVDVLMDHLAHFRATELSRVDYVSDDDDDDDMEEDYDDEDDGSEIVDAGSADEGLVECDEPKTRTCGESVVFSLRGRRDQTGRWRVDMVGIDSNGQQYCIPISYSVVYYDDGQIGIGG